MFDMKRLYGAGAVLVAVSMPLFANGCSSTLTGAQEGLCCTGFKPGAELDAKLVADGDLSATAFAQASGDLSVAASAALDDVTTACRNIAQDLDAPAADQKAATELVGAEQTKKWCALAVTMIGTVKASATITATFDPPKCQASFSAKANCEAKCSGKADVKCDYKANPPVCKGGTLEVSCKGECAVTAEQPKITCEGKCAATCEGSCAATVEAPLVDCKGTCQGTCKGAAQGGTGDGVKADGSCDGKCEGTCKATPGSAAIKCEGSCKGSCTGSCTAQGGVSAKCSGSCKADFEPLSCSGGTLEGGCKADIKAECSGNCDASVKANASCTPPQVVVKISGAASANIARLQATLEANLPKIVLVFKARGKAFADLTVQLQGSASGAVKIKPACLIAVTAALADAATNAGASVQASASVAGAAGVN